MIRYPDADTKLESKEEAIDQGRTHGMSAWDYFLPPEMFEEVLKSIVGGWRHGGCDPGWIVAGEEAADAAYRGKSLEPRSASGRAFRLS